MDNQHLTPRQSQILALLAQQKSNQEIANELGISVNTVPNHLRKIYSKLGVTSRAEAAFAFQPPEMPHQPLPAPISVLLSGREAQIMRLVVAGKSRQEIANELGISINTVPNHLRKIYSKLGVTSRAEAAFAFQHPDMLPQQLPAPLSSLSGREMQIMRLMIGGKSRQEVAETFGVNVNALAQYLYRIYTKLDVANLAQALLLCQKHLTPVAELPQQLPADTSENHDEELWNAENPFRQVNLLNHRIAVHRAITATIYNQPGTILLAFYDVQKQRFSLLFKPTEGSRRILNFDESGWQALLQQIR